MRRNTIIIEPLGGLANRMRAIAGAADLARQTRARLIVVWTLDATLRCPLGDLFEPLPCRVYECRLPSWRHRLLTAALALWPGLRRLDDAFINARCKPAPEGVARLLGGRSLYIRACENITQTRDMSLFRPAAPLLARSMAADWRHTTGLHIRRTDNTQARRHSPTRLFISRIEAEISRDPGARFYLATDSPDEERTLTARFPGRITVMPKASLDRGDPEAVRLALLDLWHLSRCRHILGSYWSSFSDIAADWGHTTLERLTAE